MRKEDECRQYRQELERSQRRLAELQEKGVAALSRYDREIAYGGDDARAIMMSTWLVSNHIRYFTAHLLIKWLTPVGSSRDRTERAVDRTAPAR